MTDLTKEIRYLPTHEWGRIDEDGVLTVGISDQAQGLLGDIVFIELPEIGSYIDAEEESAIVESVKAASDIYAPLSGEVIEINEKLLDEPETVNTSPLQEGWFYKIRITSTEGFESLMTEEEYQIFCEEE
ncbi:MAG: glycine cleavage system protein H [Gammaproteobacteria bacterium]|jgi:glycine cleavage system H protein|nr:glycine cleavage system protein H [Gammaproteobacteria bacterium]HJL96296.1 glycine cleavage system protein GcvH [SAR86 cluster bacterium]HJM59325.1 glycine cleavage system protein GcvH [SAR86 cluster bacterium]|tara:strand:- start:13453 stop:13842 length:390 start_codon:yes stop_codon:yes gene_type:complete